MAHLQITPQILKPGGAEDKGDSARLQYFVGAIAVGDMVKSTLGPKGRDKVLQPMGGEGSSRAATTITNDGATILKSVWLDNPAAKILVDVSRRQDTKCGDGTTGVVVLAAELLRQAEQLVEAKVHPQVIIAGYRLALQAAQKSLENMQRSIAVGSKEQLRDLLTKVAKTTLSSKLVTHEKTHFASLAVNAVMSLAEHSQPGDSALNLDLIQITKCPGGTVKDSFLAEGFILPKRLPTGAPKKLTDCKVLVANTPMDTDKIKVYGARVKVDSFEAVAQLEKAEKEKMKRKVEAIAKHGCNVFVNRQLIYNYPEELFRNLNILCIEHADFDGIEKLAAVLGAEIASTFDSDGYSIRLGACQSIEEYQIGEEKYIKFNGTKEQGACSIVLRGANLHILDEAERSLHDALAVLSILVKDPRFVLGAGAAELAMAEAVDELARSVVGKRALAVEAFAKGLRSLPSTILDNGGLDSAAIVTKLRALHHQGYSRMGIDIVKGDVADVLELGILESYTSKLSQVSSAAEAAEMITRVDDVIRCAPRKREGM